MSHTRISLVVVAGSLVGMGQASHAQLNAPASLDGSRAYQAELIADAFSRESMLADGTTNSGYANNHFFMGDDGNNTLNIDGFIQARFISDFRKDQPSHGDLTSGFQMRRTRLIFSGTVWDKHLFFQIQPDFDKGTGKFTLMDSFAKYSWDNGTYVRWGQYKPPLLREELVSDPNQLTVERSLVNAIFTANRSQGVGVGWVGKDLRVIGDFNDGINALNTDFKSTKESDYCLTGRAEWLFAGDDFKRFDDFTSWKGSSYGGMLGAAVNYQDGGSTGYTTDKSIFEATADCSVEGDGWNAYVEGVWRDTRPASVASTTDFGVLAQAGFFVSDQIEVFGRYDVVIPDIGSNFNTITAGASYYLSPHSHAAQLTADVQYMLDRTTNASIIPAGNTGTEFLVDPNGHQVSVRIQMQVVF